MNLRYQGAAVALALLGLTSVSPAQQQLRELGPRYLPADADYSAAVALGDVDGDGDCDAVIGNTNGQNRLYLDDGTGVFTDVTATRMPAGSESTRAVALGDVDGDGDLDIVFGNTSTRNRLYLNDGTGAFVDVTAARMPVDSDITTSIALVDVDGDGDLDMVLGNLTTQNRLYLNTGSVAGTFVDATAGRMPVETYYTMVIRAADVDGDGDQDLLVGNTGASSRAQNRLYLNEGTGFFADATASHMPADTDFTTSAAVADFDGDGDVDVVFGNSSQQNKLCLNDGRGHFVDATSSRLPPDSDTTTAVALGDVDGDGDQDLVIGNDGAQDRLYLNEGGGVFSDATASRMPVDQGPTLALAIGDVDGDGDQDLLLGYGGSENHLYLGDRTGSFTDVVRSSLPFDVSVTTSTALGDVDGDGDLDLVVGNDGAPAQAQNRLYLNDGAGVFTDVTAARMPVDSDRTSAVALCDVDGDGDLDMVVGNAAPAIDRLYVNDGTGFFSDVTLSQLPAIGVSTTGVAAGDVDGDGLPDLVLATSGSRSRLYLNQGAGQFTNGTVSHMPPRAGYTLAVALADVDGDGDLDMMLGNTGTATQSQNQLYLNDGMGFFTDATAAQMPVDTDVTYAVVLGDVDGDGDADAVLGNSGSQNRLYVNDGQGRFTDATYRMPVDGDYTTSVVLGDIDGDGAPDLVIGNLGLTGQRQNRLYLNDGAGSFTDVTVPRMAIDDDMTRALSCGDVDGDGDADLVTGNTGENRVYRNLLRQLDAPFLARVGYGFRLDAYARYGASWWADVVIPFIADAPAHIALPPFGTLGIDPSRAVRLPALLVPQPAGVVSLSLPVPAVPALTGVSLFAQGLQVKTPLGFHLSNVVTATIVEL